MSHNDCSNGEVSGLGEARGRSAARLSRVITLSLALLGGGAASALAQTPGTPSTDPSPQQQPGQPQGQGQTEPTTPSPATPEVQPAPLQQYPIQQPGRTPLTPGMPPATTLPPWTPPLPPAPSQTNIPAPLPVPVPGAPGMPGTAGYTGIPNLSLPGAFSPTITSVRGATLEFHPTLRASEEYSDNFFQTSSHAQDNFRSTLGPGFIMLVNGARTFGSLVTTVDLVHDTVKNAGDEVKVFPSVNAAIRYLFTPRLSLTVTDTFVRNDSPSAVDQFGLRRGRQVYDTNALGVTVDWLLDQIATQAYYRNVLFFNESGGGSGTGNNSVGSNVNQNDQVTNILGLNASTRVLVDYLVRLGYEFSRTDTMNGSSNSNTGNNDNTSHTVFAAFSRQFGLYTTAGISTSAQFQTQDSTRIYNASLFGAYGLPSGLSLSAAVGYSILDSDTRNTEGAVSANVTASYRFNRAFFSVGVFQDFRQTAQQGQNFGTVQTRSYFGSFLYQWTPFINTTLNVLYNENEPTGTGNDRNTNQSQNTLTYGASVNWQILRWLAASLRYTYTKQTGTNTFSNNQGQFGGGDYSENRGTLNLFATF